MFVQCTEAEIAPLRQQGIRLATYLDDWLLLAWSKQEAMTQMKILIKHLVDLDFIINVEKSVLSSIGLSLDSMSFTACLSAERVKAFRASLTHFRLHNSVPFRLCFQLLGLMVSAILVVRLGRLHMRDFQRWVASLRMNPVRHGARRVTVTVECAMALHCWRHPALLVQGVSSYPGRWSRESVGLERNLQGLVCEESLKQRSSAGPHKLFITLKHFLPFLGGHHVLVTT